MHDRPPDDPQWLNRRLVAILKARAALMPDAMEDAINNFVAVKAATIIDPTLRQDPLVTELLRHPTDTLDQVENTVQHGHHQRCYAFERIGKRALFLTALGPERTLVGPDEALEFLRDLGKEPELEAIGSTSFHLAAQEAWSYDLNEANTFWRLSLSFRDYTHIVRYAAQLLDSV